jgi:hypothetical protein
LLVVEVAAGFGDAGPGADLIDHLLPGENAHSGSLRSPRDVIAMTDGGSELFHRLADWLVADGR